VYLPLLPFEILTTGIEKTQVSTLEGQHSASLGKTNMQKYLMAVVLVMSSVAPVMAAEVFYIIFDTTLNGCTIATTPRPATKFWGRTIQKLKLRRLSAR
jgi:hypothetical protein